MRATRFRDVLWDTARKLGLDPEQGNFLDTQAIGLGEAINQWVRRTYPAKDWPEWTKISACSPVDHIVAYEPNVIGPASTVPIHIFRVFAVYLVDPATTDSPVKTDFTLREEGVHVGFDHGTNVWVKHIEPPPRFTAVLWVADTIYAKNDVAYSYTSGHVYKSKANGNQGHDPAVTFSPPPPHLQPPIQLPSEIVQTLNMGNVGITEQNQIVDVIFHMPPASIGTIPNPPPVNARFFVEVVDVNGGLLGDATSIANGTDTLDLIVTDLYNQLVSDLSGFTVTMNALTFTIRLEDNSNFRVNQAFWGRFAQPNQSVPVNQIQAYIPAVATDSSERQVIGFPLTPEQVTPGAIYSLTFKDLAGADHVVTYTATLDDNNEQVLTGLINNVAEAYQVDPFFTDIFSAMDPSMERALFGSGTEISLDAQMTLPGSPWWELVPFPTALADAVMRGGYADILKEWGQTDKAMAEEPVVPQELQVSAYNYQPADAPLLTTQQQNQLSRYRIK